MIMLTQDSFTLENISESDLKNLKKSFTEAGGKVTGEDTGQASSECFEVNFEYLKVAQTLAVKPLRMMPNMTSKGVKGAFHAFLEPKLQLSTPDRPRPTPYSCAVYNQGAIFIQNDTHQDIVYSSFDTSHGVGKSRVSDFPPGTTYNSDDQATNGAFSFNSPKDSVQGCTGSVIYTLADGTTVNVKYNINTSVTYSASAGPSGTNAASYDVTCDYDHHYGSATDYLYVYVTIARKS